MLFGGAADGERVPLGGGDCRHVDEDVVTRVIIKVLGSLDDQVGDARGQQHGRTDKGLAFARHDLHDAPKDFQQVNRAGHQQP